MGHDGMLRRGRALIASLAALALPATGQPPGSGPPGSLLYSCVANGKTYTADRPPAECADSDIRELNRDGSLRRVIPRPLTPEEKRARALEAKKKLEEEEQRIAQRRRDRSLLESYANEEEIEAGRRKALETAEQTIGRSNERLAALAKERQRLDQEAEFYANRPQPVSLKYGFEQNEQSVSTEKKVIAEANAEIARINQRFDAEKRRFRELLAQGARPVQRNPETDILLDPRFSGRQK